MEQNLKAGQNPPRVVAPTEEEEEEERKHNSAQLWLSVRHVEGMSSIMATVVQQRSEGVTLKLLS